MMDNNNWRPPPPGPGGGVAVGEAVPEGDDWRKHLPAESRQLVVNKIWNRIFRVDRCTKKMGTLKRHLPFSCPEGLQELSKIAIRFEEKNFLGASSQLDYLRKISLKMLTMESKSQNSVTNSMPSNSAVLLDFTAQSSQANGGDWQQEETYQKIKSLNLEDP